MGKQIIKSHNKFKLLDLLSLLMELLQDLLEDLPMNLPMKLTFVTLDYCSRLLLYSITFCGAFSGQSHKAFLC